MIYIGIDPGVHTGLAVYDSKRKKLLQVETLPIHQALEVVKGWNSPHWHDNTLYNERVQVIFEDARQRKWYKGDASAKMQGAGSIKRDCTIWEDFCKDYDISFRAIPPQGGMTKWDAEYFKRVTGWTGRTSNHGRDAAVLVFGRA